MRSQQRTRHARSGFTLVELLIVVAVMSILAVISYGVYSAQMARVPDAGTRSLIAVLHSALGQKLEQFRQQPVPTPLAPAQQFWRNLADAAGAEPNVVVERRERLLWQLHTMRGTFPQQFIDFVPVTEMVQPGGAMGIADPTLANPGRQAIYQEFISRYNPANHRPETESAACLFLLLTTGNVGFDVSQIDRRYIRDTDGDGLMEFVDGWGTPLRFYRWPTDYLEYLTEVTQQLSPDLRAVNYNQDSILSRPAWFDARRSFFEGPPGSNPFVHDGSFFRLHDIFPNRPNITFAQMEPDVNRPWAAPCTPLIVSAGPDGAGFSADQRWRAFGLVWPENGSAPAAADLDARCGRVHWDPEIRAHVDDNITNLTIQAGRN